MTSLRPGQWLTIALVVVAIVVGVALAVLFLGIGQPPIGGGPVGPWIAP